MATRDPEPAHVTALKNTLLDLDKFVGIETSILVLSDKDSEGDENDAIPLSAYKPDASKASQRLREKELLEDARALAEGAEKLESACAKDFEWQKLFCSTMLSRVEDFECFSTQLAKNIAYARYDVWDTFLDPSDCSPTEPKPDMYFGFPIYTPEDEKTPRVENSAFSQNYNFDLLSKLSKQGLCYTPISSSQDKEGSTQGLKDPTLCFPWCIMESTATTSEGLDFCLEKFRQASIAASTALSMFEILARFSQVKQEGQHIQPVITIMSCGPHMTVGISYSEIVDAKNTDHKILSIWDGCITKIWDAIQFCRIVENIFAWSQHTLRHNVSHYIEEWKLEHFSEGSNIYSRPEGDLKTAKLLHRIQDRLSSLNISSSLDLTGLIQQTVIYQEIVRSDIQTPKLAPSADAKAITSQQVASIKPPSYGNAPNLKSSTTIAIDREQWSKLYCSYVYDFKIPQKFKQKRMPVNKMPFDVEAWRDHQNLLPVGRFSVLDDITLLWKNFPLFTASGPTNPFKAKNFEPQIKLDPSLIIQIPIRLSKTRAYKNERPSDINLPRKHRPGVKDDASTSCDGRAEPSTEKIADQDLANNQRPPLLRIKVPWKGKSIIVRLPPPPPPKSPNKNPYTGRAGIVE